MKILLVDDDRSNRESIAELLDDLGHDVVQSGNGLDALKIFHTAEFSMVLSDIKMPGMSGIELLQVFSAMPGEQKPVVVLFTGHGDMESAIAALRGGAFDYLLKPVNVKELVRVLVEAEKRCNLGSTPGSAIRILLLNDNFIVREGLQAVLRHTRGFQLVGTVTEDNECFDIIKKSRPNVILMDANPGNEGNLELCAKISNCFPDIKVIILSSDSDADFACRCINRGASAFVSQKSTEPGELRFIIKKVTQGGRFIDPFVTGAMLNLASTENDYFQRQKMGRLTDQELAVLRALSRGKTNKEIAEELYLSMGTVRNYVSSVLKKLEFPNRAAATAFAIKNLKYLRE